MLFDIRKSGNAIQGWVSPDNPGKPPVIKIIRPDNTTMRVETNQFRPDVRDSGLHPTGHNGFLIDARSFPALAPVIDKIHIVDEATDVLLYRPYNQAEHLPLKIFRLELQAMPYAQLEAAWDSNFALYYNAVERHPFDTLFAILNNPTAQSIALSGRPSFQRYNALFRDRGYKIVTLLKHPLEEMAERLLFVRYVLQPSSPKSFKVHLGGLHPLGLAVQNIDFDKPESVAAFFSGLSFQQRAALENPMVRVLACNVNETPERRHVELALSNLAGMDVVGVAHRSGDFHQILTELLGRDIYAAGVPGVPAVIKSIAEGLADVKAARDLVALDIALFELVEEAIGRVLHKPEFGGSREAVPVAP